MERGFRERGRHPGWRAQPEQRPGDSMQPGTQGKQEQLMAMYTV